MKERKGKAKNVGAKVITIGGIFGKTMNCEKDLPSSRDGGVGPMNTGLVAREVFLQHLPYTSRSPLNCTPKVGYKIINEEGRS